MKIIRVTTVPSSLSILLKGQLLFMKQNGFEVIAVSSTGLEVADLLRNEQCEHYTILMSRAISPFSDLKALIKMYALFKKEKPLLVHSHTPKAGLIAMLAAYLAHIPVRLHTVAGLPLIEKTGAKRKLLEFIEKITYACAHKVYPNSKNLASFITNNKYCSPAKIKVLGNGSSNGIDTEYFSSSDGINEISQQLKSKLNIDDSKFVFIYVGRLVKDKGIKELIDAFTKLEKKHPHALLLLVGTPEPELDPLSNETIKRMDENEKIIKTGFQKDIRPFLALSNALVFPTYREGFPNVPMQAGCFNLPSIVTDINGCNEIVEHLKNGIIIPPKNEAALYKAMENMIEDINLYSQLKQNARKMIVERFNQKRIWFLLLEEYRSLLKNNVDVS